MLLCARLENEEEEKELRRDRWPRDPRAASSGARLKGNLIAFPLAQSATNLASGRTCLFSRSAMDASSDASNSVAGDVGSATSSSSPLLTSSKLSKEDEEYLDKLLCEKRLVDGLLLQVPGGLECTLKLINAGESVGRSVVSCLFVLVAVAQGILPAELMSF